MYSYEEFKRELQLFGLVRRDIYYIIGVFFEMTNGFEKSYHRQFGGFPIAHIVDVSWSAESYGWNVNFIRRPEEEHF